MRSASGGIASSFCATRYQEGSDFHAGARHDVRERGRGECLLHGVHHPCARRVDIGGEVVDEVVFGEPAEAARVGEQMGERRRDRSLREKCAERFALVEAERGDVDEPDDVRCVRAERGDDLAAVGVSDDDRGALLELEHLAQPRDVVGERAQRELRRSHLEALRLEALDHAAPAGSVGPGAVDENDVRPSVHCRLPSSELWKGECRRRGAGAHHTIVRFESASGALGYARLEERCRRAPRGSSTGATRNSR